MKGPEAMERLCSLAIHYRNETQSLCVGLLGLYRLVESLEPGLRGHWGCMPAGHLAGLGRVGPRHSGEGRGRLGAGRGHLGEDRERLGEGMGLLEVGMGQLVVGRDWLGVGRELLVAGMARAEPRPLVQSWYSLAV